MGSQDEEDAKEKKEGKGQQLYTPGDSQRGD